MPKLRAISNYAIAQTQPGLRKCKAEPNDDAIAKGLAERRRGAHAVLVLREDPSFPASAVSMEMVFLQGTQSTR